MKDGRPAGGPVLLLIDLQIDFLSAADLFPSAELVTAGAAKLVTEFRKAAWPVIHVWTTIRLDPDRRLAHWRLTDDRRCLEGSRGHEPPAALRPEPGEIVIHKTGYSAFLETGIERFLPRPGTAPLVLAGTHLHGCVRTTALDAYQRGWEVWVAEDAVAGDDRLHGEISRHYMTRRSIAFVPTAHLLERWRPEPKPASRSGRRLPAAVLGRRRLGGPADGARGHVSPRDPSRTLWRVPEAGEGEVDATVRATLRKAADWRLWDSGERIRVFRRLADILQSESEPLARRMAEEIGKPLRHGRAEMKFAVELLRAAVSAAEQSAPPPAAGGAAHRRLPLGVVALVTPWNNPAAVPLGKLAPALLFGNAAVWKPSPPGSGVALELLRRLEGAGVPPGVAALVCGGRSTAETLMAHPAVDAIALTGSESAGTTAAAIAARRGIPLQAELGGNNATIVWSDADLDAAAEAVAEAAFGAAGQRCTATRRVIVARNRRKPFLDRLVAAAGSLGWGDPLEEDTSVGPVISREALERISAAVDRARARGLETIVPPPFLDRAEELSRRGFYYPPTFVSCDDPTEEIVQEETFGPVLVIQSADEWDHALKLLNGVRQGLAASLFSDSPRLRKSFLEQAQAGVLKIGEATAGVDARLPFGGWKSSGMGPPEHGDGDLQMYTRLQSLYFDRKD